MDVQLAPATLPPGGDGTSLGAVAAAVPAPAPSAPVADTAVPAKNGTAPAPLPHDDQRLHDTVSKLFGEGAKVQVSFEVLQDPAEVATVFRNAATGEIIASFPSDVMHRLAQFFQQLAGGVLDQSA